MYDIIKQKGVHFSMTKIIMGLKGMGKTKTLISLVNEAVSKGHGNVVCIEKDMKLRYDISYNARLISASEYKINSFDKFYGFICGLVAGNYDITNIYVDSVLRICSDNLEEFEAFLNAVDAISQNITVVMTASYDADKATEGVKKYFM